MGLTATERNVLYSQVAAANVDAQRDWAVVKPALEWAAREESCCAAEVRIAVDVIEAQLRSTPDQVKRALAALRWINRNRPKHLDRRTVEVLRFAMNGVQAQSARPSRAITLAGTPALRDHLVSELRRQWPSVEELAFDDGEHLFTLGASALASIALCSPAVRGSAANHLIVLLPSVGAIPVFAAIGALVGEMTASHRQGLPCQRWPAGSPVVLDGERMVFQGGDETTLRFQPEGSTRLIPADQCGRVYPSSQTSNGRPHPVVDQVSLSLGLKAPFHFEHLAKSVLCISPKTRSDYVTELDLDGQALPDVFPVAPLDKDGNLGPCRGRFGSLQARMRLACDVSRARLHLESLGASAPISAVIIDAAATSGHTSHLDGLAAFCSIVKQKGIPCVVFVDDPGLDTAAALADAGYLAWDWDLEDFPTEGSQVRTHGPLELRSSPVMSASLGVLTVHELQLQEATDAHAAFRTFRIVAKGRGADCPAEIVRLLGDVTSIFHEAMRLATSSFDGEYRRQQLVERVQALEIGRRPMLSEQEQEALDAVLRCFAQLMASLETDNPKARAVKELLLGSPGALAVDYRLSSSAVSSFLAERSGDRSEPIILTSWTWASPVQKLVRSRGATPIHLVLYPFEVASFRSWSSEQDRRRSGLNIDAARKKIVPRAPERRRVAMAPPPELPAAGETEAAEERSIDELLQGWLRRRYDQSHRGGGTDVVPARLVQFEGGFHALLTDAFVGNVIDVEHRRIERKAASDIEAGDLMLFYTGGDRDVIRDLADRALPAGTRDLADTWWRALRRYAEAGKLSPASLVSKLEKLGCIRGAQAVRGWLAGHTIAPRDESDIDSIAKLTGDERLRQVLERCKAATAAVRSEHYRVGGELATKVVAQIASRGINTRVQEATVDLDGGVRAVEVISVLSSPVTADREQCNRLQEDG